MALEPNEHLRKVAKKYIEEYRFYGMEGITEGHYVHVDRNRAEVIALEYSYLPAEDLSAADAYDQLRIELVDQWYWILGTGYTLEPWNDPCSQPYANSEEMRKDVRENKHLYFFTGGEPHPFLGSHTHTGFTGNEMLRAVHDIFGHAAEGYGFGARGEENAWIHHSMMFSPLAQRALTTETRGQNSWVNFGPHSHLPVSERPYADQKVALLPEWVCDWKEALNANS